MAEENKHARQVAIVPESDENGDFPLAQTVFITHDEHHVFMRFLQIVPPVVLDGTPPDAVTGRLVASVCLPAELLPTLARMFSEVGRKYEEGTGRALKWSPEDQPS